MPPPISDNGPQAMYTTEPLGIAQQDKEEQNPLMSLFFNSAGLYLRAWKERFNPDTEDLSWAPVWIRLYSLPVEYWYEDALREIGKGLGEFIKIAEETKLCKYTSYTRICVFMHLEKALPESISLFHDDYERTQPLDYEHVPFHCRKCHALGHLFRDCPLNAHTQASEPAGRANHEGFTKVTSRKRSHKKPSSRKKPHQDAASIPSMSNSFEALATTQANPTQISVSIPQPII
eukprot:PITA_24996